MRISATEEYGLRCILQLARLKEGERISASQVAEQEGISVEYASKMLHLFRKGGLVLAERGLRGGFRLQANAAEISLAQVFQSLGSAETVENFCEKFSGDRNECIHFSNCSVRPVWQALFGYFHTILSKLTLADLIQGESHTKTIVDEALEQVMEKKGVRQWSMQELS